MHDKLKLLLKKIKLDESKYLFFENGKIKKILTDKEKKNWTFIVMIKNILPIEVFNEVNELISGAFTELSSARIKYEIENVDNNECVNYYKNVIEKIGLSIPMTKIFEDKNIVYENNELSIDVDNIAESNKLKTYLDKIEELYEELGFKDLKISIKINEQVSKKIKEEITKEMNENVPVATVYNPVVLGDDFKSKPIMIRNIISEDNNICIECKLFGEEVFESAKTGYKILTLKVTDYTDSLLVKYFTRDADEFDRLVSKLKKGKWYKMNGYAKNDVYAKDIVLNVRNIVEIDSKDEVKEDSAEEKRVELHTHTFMSQMDGVVSPTDLIKRAKAYGHKAIAITDHNVVQAFPEALKNAKDIKVIYGTEINMIDDDVDLISKEDSRSLTDTTFVVWDFETTGLNASAGDSIIEIGAVKIRNGEILDKYNELINPGRPLPLKIIQITNITDSMLEGKDNEENAVKRFKEWIGDLPMVAHNAKFDRSFLESAYNKYNLGTLENTILDTLEISRALSPNEKRHSLSALVKRYQVPWDEDAHHRADYDAEGTAYVLAKMIKIMTDRNFETISDINKLVSKDDIHKFGSIYHTTLLAQNEVGIRNLYKIISYANTKYLTKTPRVLRSIITEHREGLLVGSACAEGEIFSSARSKSDDEMNSLVKFYDYIEVQPLNCYDHLLQLGEFNSLNDLQEHVKRIIRLGKDNGKIVVATGDVHHLDESDKIYREIIVNQKVPGGGFHPLNKKDIKNLPTQHFMTTDEMLKRFDFIDEDLAYELVVTNSNKIADIIGEFKIIKNEKEPYTPIFENSAEETREMVYKRAKEEYGDPLPELIEQRIEKELEGIVGGGFDVIYLIAQKLVKKSNDDGYIVGSRGSVGSSFVANMMGITEVNALPPHYICPNCKKSIFELDGKSLALDYASGFDLPDRMCECGTKMRKDGQDIPFATFLGFNADKVPDIDLNFSGDYQSKAHDYTKVLFGDKYVYRAGTIGTVADKTAYGFVQGYLEDKGLTKRSAEIERLAAGCTGVKRTTGQHPGGIVVIPNYMDVFDFTPYQYPADDASSPWYTTHFDFHAIHDYVLKLDILGHDDPTVLRMLQDLSGINIKDIPLDDKDVYTLFTGPEALGVTKEQIMCETGTIGLPEMGTKFVIQMLVDTKPTTFGELLKVSGLSHGTDVWLGNAQELIKNNICEFKKVIGCRDDIMVYLMQNGMEPLTAFKIMEFVRKGRPSKEPDEWLKHKQKMQEAGIVDWYIESCQKIKYMFPKAHAAAYIIMAIRVAWFKVHQPIRYYAAYLSIRTADFDIECMLKGYEAIKARLIELQNKGFEATNKEQSVISTLQSALEMTARGFTFKNIDLYKSEAMKFVIDEDQKSIIFPFRAIEGLGDTVAYKIVEERNNSPFVSIEDLQKRGKVSQTLIEKMKVLGILNNMPESNQLSLF